MGQTTFSGPVVSQNGFIDSSFTDAERDAIVDPQPGLLIYNTTSNTYEVYSGTAWDTAFGPGGGGAGSFPYLLTDLGSYAVPSSGMAMSGKATKILFSPDGMQALALGTSGINVAVLSVAYDLGTTYNTYPFYVASPFNGPLGACFNGNGTTIYTFDAQSDATVQIRSFAVGIPYDLTQINTATEANICTLNIGFSMNNDYARGFEVSSDGTKLMFSVSGNGFSYLRTFEIPTPYNFAALNTTSWTGNVDITNDVANLHYMGSGRIWGLAVNSTGTVVYGSVNGYTTSPVMAPVTFIIEFKLGTAYDVNSIQDTYTQATSAPVDLSNSNFGVTLANSNIYIGGYDMSYGNPRYNLNSLTVIAAPNITGVSPSSGGSGSSVTITGTGFTGTTAVTFGSASATFTVVSSTQITATVPGGSGGLVDITVTNPAGSSTEVGAFTRTGPVGTTYAQGAEYVSGGIMLNGAGSGMQIILDRTQWSPTTGYYNIVSQPTSTQYTLSVNGNTAVIATLTSFSSSGPGQVAANCYVVSGDFGPFSNSAVTQITFTQAPVTFAEAVDYTPIYLSVNESGLYLSNVSTDLTNNANGDAASNKTLLITLGNIGQTFSATVTSSSAGMSGPNSAIIQFTPPYTGAGGYITSFTLS